jgi:hypothetical protein
MNAPLPTSPPPTRRSVGKWLLRIFLGCFLVAVAAPLAIAFAVLNVSGDTRALRNAVVRGDDARWQKQLELNLGSIPFTAARLALPFIDIPPDAKLAFSALRGVEFSIHELKSSQPDRARIIADADARMTKRGWDRVVAVIDGKDAVAVYVQSGPGSEISVSTLVINGRQMIAATGHGKLEPLFQLAMKKAEDEGLLDRSRTK